MGVRLGVVSYLNTHPLVYAFEQRLLDHDFELVYDVPSICADKLHRQETDLALIPAAEIGRGPEPYCIVPDVGLISNGPVRSVLLVLGKDPDEIQTLALDTSSRTSVVLSQIVLARQFECRPQTFTHVPDLDTMLQKADAALLIGDRALALDATRYRVLDLGEAWMQMTGLPFVYACWTGRADAISPPDVDKLIAAKAHGMANVSAIADAYAEDHALLSAFYAEYLMRHMVYDLGEAEIEGLRRFYAYGAELDLIKTVPDILFYHQQ